MISKESFKRYLVEAHWGDWKQIDIYEGEDEEDAYELFEEFRNPDSWHEAIVQLWEQKCEKRVFEDEEGFVHVEEEALSDWELVRRRKVEPKNAKTDEMIWEVRKKVFYYLKDFDEETLYVYASSTPESSYMKFSTQKGDFVIRIKDHTSNLLNFDRYNFTVQAALDVVIADVDKTKGEFRFSWCKRPVDRMYFGADASVDVIFTEIKEWVEQTAL